MWSNFLTTAKGLFQKHPPQPREPRKKIELQLKSIHAQFLIQVQLLEPTLERRDLSESTRMVGKQILQSASRFQELQLARINRARLQSLPTSLIDPGDFSIWVIWEMKNLTEEIQYFISSIE
ncbi:MAG: hypothetical protein ACXAD7_00325 [Candidatus Kariarchaeaceae archaeon]|jgi:hypothetical protein